MIPASNTATVTVIGGGVIGLTIARALALRGVRVLLIERGALGAEASSAAGGTLAPQIEADRMDDFCRLACASRDMYPEFAAALKEESGVDVELDRTGTLYVGFTERDEVEFRRRYEWQIGEKLRVEWLSGDEARKLEPNISVTARCALRLPDDWQVENRRLIDALVVSSQKLGVHLVSECAASSLHIEQGKIRGVETSSGLIRTAIVVLAAGAWTSLIRSREAPLPLIEPVRGQMLCFEAPPQIVRSVIYGSRGYLVPRRDGRLLAGSTTERVGFDRNVTSEGIEGIKEMALEIVPAVRRFSMIDSWANFRPRAQDSLPILGPCDQVEGLFYATGHYRTGILLAPITGEVIANAIVSGAVPPTLNAFSPSRFEFSRSCLND